MRWGICQEGGRVLGDSFVACLLGDRVGGSRSRLFHCRGWGFARGWVFAKCRGEVEAAVEGLGGGDDGDDGDDNTLW